MKCVLLLAVTLVGPCLSSPVINIQINTGGAGEMDAMKGAGAGGNDGGEREGSSRGSEGDDRPSTHPPPPPGVMNPKHKQWLIAVGSDYAALEYKDDEGHLDGFHFDLIEAVCNAAEMNCTTVLEPYDNCITEDQFAGKGLSDKWYDACSGWDKTPRRSEFFQFSKPYLADTPSEFYFVEGGSFNVYNMTEYSLIGFQEMISTDPDCVARHYPGSEGVPLREEQIKFFPSYEELTEAIINGEVAAGFMNTLEADKYGGLEKVGHGPVCTDGASMMSRKDSNFPAEWNKGYKIIRDSGELERICRRARKFHVSEDRNFPGCADVDE